MESCRAGVLSIKKRKSQKAQGSKWRIVFELDLQLGQQSETALSLHEEKGETHAKYTRVFHGIQGKTLNHKHNLVKQIHMKLC